MTNFETLIIFMIIILSPLFIVIACNTKIIPNENFIREYQEEEN